MSHNANPAYDLLGEQSSAATKIAFYFLNVIWFLISKLTVAFAVRAFYIVSLVNFAIIANDVDATYLGITQFSNLGIFDFETSRNFIFFTFTVAALFVHQKMNPLLMFFCLTPMMFYTVLLLALAFSGSYVGLLGAQYLAFGILCALIATKNLWQTSIDSIEIANMRHAVSVLQADLKTMQTKRLNLIQNTLSNLELMLDGELSEQNITIIKQAIAQLKKVIQYDSNPSSTSR